MQPALPAANAVSQVHPQEHLKRVQLTQMVYLGAPGGYLASNPQVRGYLKVTSRLPQQHSQQHLAGTQGHLKVT